MGWWPSESGTEYGTQLLSPIQQQIMFRMTVAPRYPLGRFHGVVMKPECKENNSHYSIAPTSLATIMAHEVVICMLHGWYGALLAAFVVNLPDCRGSPMWVAPSVLSARTRLPPVVTVLAPLLMQFFFSELAVKCGTMG